MGSYVRQSPIRNFSNLNKFAIVSRHKRIYLVPYLFIFIILFNPIINFEKSIFCRTDTFNNFNNQKEFNLICQVGGKVNAIAARDQYLFAGIGLRMVILDFSKISKARQAGETEVLKSQVSSIFLLKNYAYVCIGESGLVIIDIKNIKNPRIIGNCSFPGFSENIVVEGPYAFISNGWAGLIILDISKPQEIKILGTLTNIGYAYGIEVYQNKAYIAAGGSGLKIIDIADKNKPFETSQCETPGCARGLVLNRKKKTVYVADEWEGVQIIDVSNSKKPVLKGTLKTPGRAFDLALNDHVLCVADAFKGLRIVDIHNSYSSQEIGNFEFDGHAGQVISAGNSAYLVDEDNGIRVIDISSPQKPVQISLFSILGNAYSLDVFGNYVFVAGRNYGLRIIDIKNYSRAKEIGFLPLKGDATCISVSGSKAYVLSNERGINEEEGLRIVDIFNPNQPRILSFYPYKGAYFDMQLLNAKIFAPNEHGLGVFSVNDPNNPDLMGFLFLMESPETVTLGVDVVQNTAYVSCSMGGLKIVDVSKPKHMKLLGQYRHADSFSHDSIIWGNVAYIADYHGIRIVDVTDSSRPSEIGFLNTNGEAVSLARDGNILYVANGKSGILALDISFPSLPHKIAEYDTPGNTQKIAIKGDKIFVADGEAGLLIFELKQKSKMERKSYYAFSRSSNSSFNFNNWKSSSVFLYRHLHNLKEVNSSGNQSESNLSTEMLGNKILTVTKKGDKGPGSLRWCLENSERGTKIIFDPILFPPLNPAKIKLKKPLPALQQGGIKIDASNAGVILDGSRLKKNDYLSTGILIQSDDNVIRGLQVLNFPSFGIWVMSGENNLIGGNRDKGSGLTGQGNVLSGNGYDGLYFQSSNNTALGNLIGVDVSGKKSLGNNGAGIGIDGSENQIGSEKRGEGNIVGNNRGIGIGVFFHTSSGNRIIGNKIGTDITGFLNFGNGEHGVTFELGPFNNLVKDNIICGNNRAGINISDVGSSYNTIVGNIIGMDGRATTLIPNEWTGIFLGDEGSYNRVGGKEEKEGNIICGGSSNTTNAMSVGGAHNLIMGNFIGTDKTGAIPVGQFHGILMGGYHNIIGGFSKKEKNVICAAQIGISLMHSSNAMVLGNFFGLNPNGSYPISQMNTAVLIAQNTFYNVLCSNSICGSTGVAIMGAENILFMNKILKSGIGVKVSSHGNLSYLNTFIDNSRQAEDSGYNLWDKYNMGNYWSDYSGVDSDGDGIGDIPYRIFPNGRDNYPLMKSPILKDRNNIF